MRKKFEQIKIDFYCWYKCQTYLPWVGVVACHLAIMAIAIAIMFCQGCVLVSDAKYNADAAMWQAKAEASKAWAASANQPLATFTATSGEVFTVNNPNRPNPLPVVGEPSAIVQGFDVILNSTVAKIVGGGWAAGYMLGKVQGNYSAGDGSSIDVTKDSGNTVDVTTRHIEGDGSVTEEANVDSRSNYDNATSDPTIVNQPEPTIVNQPEPTIVNPVVVNPVVVNPVIVNQTTSEPK